MVRVDQTEIFRNKRTTIEGILIRQRFPFQWGRMEITVPFAQNFHFYFVVLSRHQVSFDLPMKLQVWNVNRKKAFIFEWKRSVNFQSKFLANWRAPLVYVSYPVLASCADEEADTK